MEINFQDIIQLPYSELKAMLVDLKRTKPKDIGVSPIKLKELIFCIENEMKARLRGLFLDEKYFEEQEKIRKEKIQKLKEHKGYDDQIFSDDPNEYYLLLRKLNAHVSVALKLGVTEEFIKHENEEYFSYLICTKSMENEIVTDTGVVENQEVGFKEAHVMMECALARLVDLCMLSEMEVVK